MTASVLDVYAKRHGWGLRVSRFGLVERLTWGSRCFRTCCKLCGTVDGGSVAVDVADCLVSGGHRFEFSACSFDVAAGGGGVLVEAFGEGSDFDACAVVFLEDLEGAGAAFDDGSSVGVVVDEPSGPTFSAGCLRWRNPTRGSPGSPQTQKTLPMPAVSHRDPYTSASFLGLPSPSRPSLRWWWRVQSWMLRAMISWNARLIRLPVSSLERSRQMSLRLSMMMSEASRSSARSARPRCSFQGLNGTFRARR